MPFTTSSQETEWALFFQPRSLHEAFSLSVRQWRNGNELAIERSWVN